ncbi:MAG: FixH family protein [Gammaproteobacteria bacterium]|nr:FixH family protein [Gammaproteobacteria bacterium]
MTEQVNEKPVIFSQDNKSAFRNPWVLGMLSFVIIVVLVNVAFISMAFITSPGLVTEDYYERGQDHEANVQKRIDARNRLGWAMNLTLPEKIMMATNQNYQFNVVDKYGVPIGDANVKMHAYRPSDATADFYVEMENMSAGMYKTRTGFPLKGIWDITLQVVHGEDNYDMTRRISVHAE